MCIVGMSNTNVVNGVHINALMTKKKKNPTSAFKKNQTKQKLIMKKANHNHNQK